MPDTGNAEIIIGGVLRDPEGLIDVLTISGIDTDWGGPQFLPETPEDLLNARFPKYENCNPVFVDRLVLYSHTAINGRFEELEEWLMKNKMSFDRFSGVLGEGDPEVMHFRGSWQKPRVFVTGVGGEPVLGRSDIVEILKPITDLYAKLKAKETTIHNLPPTVDRVLRAFAHRLGIGIVPVPTFVIEEKPNGK